LVVIAVASAAVTHGAEPAASASGDTTAIEAEDPPKRLQFFPPRITAKGAVFLPTMRYSSESGFGLGGEIYRKFRSRDSVPGTPVSDARLKFLYTFKGQARGELRGRLYFGGGRYSLNAKISYDDLSQRFWGIGPDTPDANLEIYRPQSALAYVELFRKLFRRLKVGLRYEYEIFELREVEPGGLLDTHEYVGLEGGNVAGLGLLLQWDTRDRRYSPTSGCYHQFFAMIFDDEFGSQYDFNVTNLDLRKYFSLFPDHVLATQVFFYEARGAGVPFWRYAALGGRAHSRGYRKGRYLDNSLLAFQGEYRFPVKWRFGAVAFAGLADVAPELSKLKFEHMRLTLGGGLRYRTGDEDDVRVRFDVAVGRRSAWLYLSLGEAF
jgi:hypothetical protein